MREGGWGGALKLTVTVEEGLPAPLVTSCVLCCVGVGLYSSLRCPLLLVHLGIHVLVDTDGMEGKLYLQSNICAASFFTLHIFLLHTHTHERTEEQKQHQKDDEVFCQIIEGGFGFGKMEGLA